MFEFIQWHVPLYEYIIEFLLCSFISGSLFSLLDVLDFIYIAVLHVTHAFICGQSQELQTGADIGLHGSSRHLRSHFLVYVRPSFHTRNGFQTVLHKKLFNFLCLLMVVMWFAWPEPGFVKLTGSVQCILQTVETSWVPCFQPFWRTYRIDSGNLQVYTSLSVCMIKSPLGDLSVT